MVEITGVHIIGGGAGEGKDIQSEKRGNSRVGHWENNPIVLRLVSGKL